MPAHGINSPGMEAAYQYIFNLLGPGIRQALENLISFESGTRVTKDELLRSTANILRSQTRFISKYIDGTLDGRISILQEFSFAARLKLDGTLDSLCRGECEAVFLVIVACGVPLRNSFAQKIGQPYDSAAVDWCVERATERLTRAVSRRKIKTAEWASVRSFLLGSVVSFTVRDWYSKSNQAQDYAHSVLVLNKSNGNRTGTSSGTVGPERVSPIYPAALQKMTSGEKVLYYLISDYSAREQVDAPSEDPESFLNFLDEKAENGPDNYRFLAGHVYNILSLLNDRDRKVVLRRLETGKLIPYEDLVQDFEFQLSVVNARKIYSRTRQKIDEIFGMLQSEATSHG